MSDLHSPRQIAQALGVSESSLKRWCDSGLIATTRTAGGHRKILTSEVIRFARERSLNLVTPELLGLPPASSVADVSSKASAAQLAVALLAGDAALSRQIVLNLARKEPSLASLFDDVIAQAFVEIGERWACHEADVYQERRSCEMILRTLAELKRMQPPPTGTLTACGGTAAGDPYCLQTLMAELVLQECGFNATSLGSSIPFHSLARAVRELQPTLFWLSAAWIADEGEFVHEFASLSTACADTRTALVIGGRALTPNLKQKLVDATCCDTMQQLAGFARALARVHSRSSSSHSGSSAP